MKKRAKKQSLITLKNFLVAVLLVAASLTVYGIAQAAVVTHQGSEIIGKVTQAAQADNSNLLQGLSAADILSGAVVTTYEMSADSYTVGSYIGAGSTSYSCPAGSKPTMISCTSQDIYGVNPCSCGVGVNNTAGVSSAAIYSLKCTGDPPRKWEARDGCTPHQFGAVYGNECNIMCAKASAPCKAQFQCTAKQSVGTAAIQQCSSSSTASGTSCNNASDNQHCNAQCTSVGWMRGESIACDSSCSGGCWRTPSQGSSLPACGGAGFSEQRVCSGASNCNHRLVTCRCRGKDSNWQPPPPPEGYDEGSDI